MTVLRIRFALVGAAVAALVLSIAEPVFAQSSDLQILLNRIERLERDIRTLNRQVARGVTADQAVAADAAMPTAVTPMDTKELKAAGGEGALTRVTVRMNDMEYELRQTTGMVEDLTFQINQLNQRVDSLITGMNYRLGRLEGTAQGDFPAPQPMQTFGGQPTVSTAPSVSSVTSAGRLAPPTATELPVEKGTVSKDGTYIPPKGANFGSLGKVSKNSVDQLTKEGETNPAQTAMAPVAKPAATPAPAAAPQKTGVLPEGSPKERYQFAFGLMRQARYTEAEAALKEFIAVHGDDALAGNARYWLAETFYVRKSFMDAAQTFFEAYQGAPGGSKAPDSLLKLGMSLANLEKSEEACATFGKLRKEFTDLKPTVEKTLDREVKRLKCK
ncbi:tol-pal system protein YbgF [Magnetovibrio sp. PR-2]|uniref:tol-pal system protein YbgF n=1 Tax=Magnetovibrio sp. PR-2 TaxID=3120356 RepID=UPI002FCE077B